MRAWITGYFGQKNVGDEAILAAVLQHVPPTVRPSVFTSRNAELLQRTYSTRADLEPPFDLQRGRYSLLKGAGYWLRRGHRIAFDIPRRKACVVAGGGWINDHVAGRALNKRKRLLALKRWNCRIGLLGIGVDRMTIAEDREAARKIVDDEVAYCSVRDTASAEALADLGVSPERYRLAADLAYALRLPANPRAFADTTHLSQAVVGLNLRPLFDASKERGDRKSQRLREYQAACRTLVVSLTRLVRELVLVPFNPADVGFLHEIAAQVGARVEHLEDDPIGMASGLRRFDAVVAMRYHAAVLAVIQGIPCVPIPYASKLIALAGECGVDCSELVVGDGVLAKDQPLTPDAVVNRLEWVWGQREVLLPRWAAVCREKACAAREDMRRCWEVLTS